MVRDLAFRLSLRKHFQNDPSGYKPEKFSSILSRIQISLVQISPTHWVVQCRLGNETRKTHVFLLAPFDSNKPSITFHHGAGQINHMLPATIVLGKQIINSCNIFVIKAQHHTSTIEYLTRSVDSFSHQQQTFAGSVLATEAIVQYHKKHSKQPIVVSGASMGGIVATLHAMLYGTGDYYVPLTAYPNVGEIFMGHEYRSAVAGWESKRKNKAYLESYRFDKKIPHNLVRRIFPVLGKFDRVVPFVKSEEFWKKQGIIPIIFPYGHFAGFIARHEIRRIILLASSC